MAYGQSGTIFGLSNCQAIASGTNIARSVEIWAEPHPYLNSATLLTFYNAPNQLRVHQTLTDLHLQDDQTAVDLDVPEAFREARPVFITFTAGPDGTRVYVDGRLARRSALQIPESSFAGKLILGDSALQPDSWRGQVFGLAIYSTEITEAQTVRHYSTWTKNGTPEIGADERNVALYLFDEHEGVIIHNKVKSGVDLRIPQAYEVTDKFLIEPFWQEFEASRSYFLAVFKNVVGFVPLGFFFYSYFSARRARRAELITVALGTSISLAIEILQWLLPTRESGATDILTNALGTWCGVQLHRYASAVLRSAFPRVASILASSQRLGTMS